MQESMMLGKAKKAMVIGLDGADPKFMKILMSEGRLPNFKKLLEMGTTTTDMGMIGALPTVTPPNWASLATGAWPNTHGITCFWNHTTGNPIGELNNAFDSGQCKAEFIWEAYAKQGKQCILFNYPTSWPPRMTENTIFVDGSKTMSLFDSLVDAQKLFLAKKGDFPVKVTPHFVDNSGADCLVEGDVSKVQATVVMQKAEKGAVNMDDSGRQKNHTEKSDRIYMPLKPAKGWQKAPENALEATLPVNGGMVNNYALMVPNEEGHYNKVQIFLSKKDEQPVLELAVGQWGEFYDSYFIGEEKVRVGKIAKLVSLAPDGEEMVLFYNNALNMEDYHLFVPQEIGPELYDLLGVSPAAANTMKYTEEGDTISSENFDRYFDWCAKAIDHLLTTKPWDLFYTHIHPIDYINHWYINHLSKSPRYREIIAKIYDSADKFIGQLLKFIDEDTVMFVTSDHGAIPHGEGYILPSIGDPNLAAGVMVELGYCKVKTLPQGGYGIDWSQTKAISQRFTNIYINLKGRDPEGIVEPEDYDALVNQIIEDLYAYRDPRTGKRVVSFALRKDQMELVNLDGDHTGDIFFQLQEEFNREHSNGLSNATRDEYSLRCLFIAAGAGIKKNTVIDRKARIVDIVPTIAYLQDGPIPAQAEGAILYQLFED